MHSWDRYRDWDDTTGRAAFGAHWPLHQSGPCDCGGDDGVDKYLEMVDRYAFEQMHATDRWMRRQRLLSPCRRVWHRLLQHEVGKYACFTCDMDLP